jgi:hypothetical protein
VKEKEDRVKLKILGIHIEDPNRANSIELNSPLNFAQLEIEFIPADPIEFREWIIPEQIECEFLIRGLSDRMKTVWKVEMILLIERGIPQTKKISISVLGKSPIYDIPLDERVEQSHLSLISSEIRELEVLALQEVRRRWGFNPDTKGWNQLATQDLSQKEINSLRKEILTRTAYRTLDPQFLKEVARLFMEAERKGLNTNVYVAEVIGRREDHTRTARTAENWIAKSREQGFLAPSTQKKPTQSKKEKTK